jgi:hypothetical protein
MAQRRMFSKNITESDSFLDMPLSTQALYFHLGMEADDDGFVTPNRVLRMISSTTDDLKLLVTKQYVIPFECGVVVISHWNEHNYIQKDRYKATIYLEEKNKLLNINNVYSKIEEKEECIQNVYKMDTQVRLGKSRVEESRLQKSNSFKLDTLDILRTKLKDSNVIKS